MSIRAITSHIIGFILSLIITISAYSIVKNAVFDTTSLIFSIVLLGVLQAIIQLILFLHLGKESKPKIRLISFLFMILMVSIIVIGTLWIMAHLQYETMPPIDVNTYLINQ